MKKKKKKAEGEVKGLMASARLDDHEKELVLAEAKRRGMNMSDFVRSAVLQKQPDATLTRLDQIEDRMRDQEQAIVELAQAVSELRETVARATNAILISHEKDKRYHPAISAWVDQDLRSIAPAREPSVDDVDPDNAFDEQETAD